MKIEDALAMVDTVINPEHLTTVQEQVFCQCWSGKTYQEIAVLCDYDADYIRFLGAQLWRKLSQAFGQKVTKNNFRSILRQQQKNHWTKKRKEPRKLELPKGIVPLNSQFYLDRNPEELLCDQTILQPGALIRIKAPRRMGKTSLMVRLLDRARQSGLSTVVLNLQQADEVVLKDLDRFLRWFCTTITRQLGLSDQVEDNWHSIYGSKSNCTAYFEDFLLSALEAPLVLALDQVDEIFSHPEIAEEFFSMLRTWYEQAAYGIKGSNLWQNIRILILHSTEVYLPLDTNKSPFNVGLAIDLTPFTYQQVNFLAQRHGLDFSEGELEQLMQLLGGHPYLVRLALYHLERKDLTKDDLWQTAATDGGIYRHHLHRLLAYLQQHPELAIAYEKVLWSTTPVKLEQELVFKLRSLGLVDLEGNSVSPSCRLYRQYFRQLLRSLSAAS